MSNIAPASQLELAGDSDNHSERSWQLVNDVPRVLPRERCDCHGARPRREAEREGADSRVNVARKGERSATRGAETTRGSRDGRAAQTVKMDWELLTIASLHLTATEHRYYGDIFIYCCENADGDSVSVIKVAELLRSASLPRDVTMKVRARRSRAT